MSGTANLLEVWLDSDLGPPCLVGTLAHDRGQIRLHYERTWLADARAFALDPDLSLDEAPFFPKPELGNFGVFLDSSPDRWGQTLMKRREALRATDERRTARTLYAWDFLIGVQDLTRQGALRFRRAGSDEFLGNEKMGAPPVTTLRELEAVALQLSSRRIDDLDALRKWLAVLVAPGASLGGARPKANFTEVDGSLGDKSDHVLNIDDSDNRASLATVLSTAAFYGLSTERATQIVEEVACVVDGWQGAAANAAISRADIELCAAAFSAHSAYRTRRLK